MSSLHQGRANVLMATACGGLFTYGVLSALLGATLPELRARVGFRMEAGGWLFSAFYLPQIPAVFVAGVLVDRLGRKLLFSTGCLLAGISMAGIAYAQDYGLLAVLLFVLGLAGSLISTGSNILVTDVNSSAPSPALNLGHTFFGLGAVAVPALMALRAELLGLRSVLGLVGALVGIIGAVGLLQRFPSPGASQDFRWHWVNLAEYARPLVLLAMITFLTTALLAALAAWVRPFLEECCRASAQESSIVLTVFWCLISLGRFIASHWAKKVSGPRLVLWACFGLVLGLVMLAVAAGLRSALAAIAVCGLCYAPIYPTTVGSAHCLFPKSFGTTLGILMASSLVGGLVFPALIGYAAGIASVRLGMSILVGAAILLVFFQTLLLQIRGV